MARAVLVEWEGREYDHSPKSADWYWVIGILAVAGGIASILFTNYLLTVLIVIAAVTITLHGAKQPPLHRFRLLEQGLAIGEELYPFDRMVSFSMLEDIEGELPPLLSIRNHSWLSSRLLIPLEGVNPDEIYAYFLAHVSEEVHEHTLVDLVAAWLGF